MLRERVIILNRKKASSSAYGLDGGGIEWEQSVCVWAAVDWAKGARSLNAGAVDAYGVVLVRMRWNPDITMRSRIMHNGITYQILPETFHANRHENTLQFNAQAIINNEL